MSTLHYTNATHTRRVLLRSRTPSLMDVRTRATHDLLLYWTTTEGQGVRSGASSEGQGDTEDYMATPSRTLCHLLLQVVDWI